jgi:hypothetical protein
MAGNFEIYKDQENFKDSKAPVHAELKREPTKHFGLAGKAIGNENARENNVRSSRHVLPL